MQLLAAIKAATQGEDQGQATPDNTEKSRKSQRIETIPELFDMAVSEGRSGNKAYSIYRAVSEGERNLLAEKIGDNLAGYKHGVDESAVRHILSEHGDPEKDVAAC